MPTEADAAEPHMPTEADAAEPHMPTDADAASHMPSRAYSEIDSAKTLQITIEQRQKEKAESLNTHSVADEQA